MRLSLGPVPKPLVPIRGVPLLERNLIALLSKGWRHIVVSAPSAIPAIGGFVRSRGRDLARVFQAELVVLEEQRPLGNIGPAGQLRDAADTVLVVYADNLTTLDVQAMLEGHYRTGADLTLATHHELFRIPFGEVRIVDGRVTEYVEKPTHLVPICSGLAVLGRRALAALPADQPTGLAALATAMIRQGGVVRAFPHSAPWIDVNDAAAVTRAEALVAAERGFECWAARPDIDVVGVLLRSAEGVLLQGNETPPHTAPAAWGLPSLRVQTQARLQEAACDLLSRLGFRAITPRVLASFDEIDTAAHLTLRHHVYTGEVACAPLPLPSQGVKLAWVPESGIDVDRAPQVVIRALAALRAGN